MTHSRPHPGRLLIGAIAEGRVGGAFSSIRSAACIVPGKKDKEIRTICIGLVVSMANAEFAAAIGLLEADAIVGNADRGGAAGDADRIRIGGNSVLLWRCGDDDRQASRRFDREGSGAGKTASATIRPERCGKDGGNEGIAGCLNLGVNFADFAIRLHAATKGRPSRHIGLVRSCLSDVESCRTVVDLKEGAIIVDGHRPSDAICLRASDKITGTLIASMRPWIGRTDCKKQQGKRR